MAVIGARGAPARRARGQRSGAGKLFTTATERQCTVDFVGHVWPQIETDIDLEAVGTRDWSCDTHSALKPLDE